MFLYAYVFRRNKTNNSGTEVSFYRAAYYEQNVCLHLLVCLSVRPSNGRTVIKRKKLLPKFFYHMKDPSIQFCNTKKG